MADDLREVVAALKIAGVVERIGDYAKNIAKRVPSDRGQQDPSRCRCSPRWRGSRPRWCTTCSTPLPRAMPTKAAAVCERDAAVDDFYNAIFRALLTHMMENPHNITPATHLLFVAKNLERIGDHATNVAEMVYFAATGEHLGDRAKGADTTGIAAGDLERAMTAKGKILLVEDDTALVELLVYHFEREDFEVAPDRATARRRCCWRARAPPDLVILDWMIEGAVRASRSAASCAGSPETANVPIIMLTARGEEERPDPRLRDRRRRLCHQALLPARAGGAGRAVLRRVRPALAGEQLHYADIEMDVVGHKVRRGGAGGRARPDRVPAAQAISSNIPAGSSRASGCSMRSGARTARSSCAPSTSISAGCARRSTPASTADIIRTVRSAGYALDAEARLTPTGLHRVPIARAVGRFAARLDREAIPRASHVYCA